LPRYSIVKAKYRLGADKLVDVYKKLRANWPQAQVNSEDGLRLDWPDRWIHVRASNTEPVVRVIAEATVAESASALCQEVAEVIEDIGRRVVKTVPVRKSVQATSRKQLNLAKVKKAKKLGSH
jgi:phosphomannomutase